MKIVRIDGNIETQIIQYLFLRFLEISLNEPCYVDDSGVCKKTEEKMDLEKIFGVHPRLLREFFSPEKWSKIMWKAKNGRSVPEQLIDDGWNLSIILDVKSILKEEKVTESQVASNEYYFVKGITNMWEEKIYEAARGEIKFPPYEESWNKIHREQVGGSNSIGVYIEKCVAEAPKRYKNALNKCRELYSSPTFFLFSLEMDWCLNHLDELGFDIEKELVIPIKKNEKGYRFRDMQLMSECKCIICSNHLFPLCAHILRVFENQKVILL